MSSGSLPRSIEAEANRAAQRAAPRSRRRWSRYARRGSTIVQAAIVLPMALMFLLGIMEYSRYLMLLQIMNNAAREGCRYAVMHTQPVVINSVTYGNNTSDVTTIISNVLAGQSLTGQSVQVYSSDSVGNNVGTWQNTQSGQWICVKITGNFTSLVPKLLNMPNTLAITAESVMRSESN
jgi:Flp pilus assembly protein TadG